MKRPVLCLILCVSAAAPTGAYEIGTHAYVTKLAVDASVLSPQHVQSIVPILGFQRLDADKTFEAEFNLTGSEAMYFDNQPLPAISLESSSAAALARRKMQNEEGGVFARLIDFGYLPTALTREDFEQRVDAWVMRGAVREDDNDVGPYSIGDRDDDPWNVVFRAGRHFYDPINNRALSDAGIACITFGCRPAIEWMLGRTNVLSGPGTLDTTRENHFSWQDARDNYWWALTYNLPESAEGLGHADAQNVESGWRKFRFATTLKSVGQVIHLLQDMAQPQHTRNDGHGPPAAQIANRDGPADGAFEAFTEYRLLRNRIEAGFSNPVTQFSGAYITVDQVPRLRLAASLPYPVPRFSTPVKYFTTRHIEGDILARRGLADLSNRGFFTATSLPVNVETGLPDAGATEFISPAKAVATSPIYSEQTFDTSLYADGVAGGCQSSCRV